MAGASRAGAQLLVSASASPNPVIVSNTAAFTISVTNVSSATLLNVTVTNLFSSSIPISSATGPNPTIFSNGVSFFVGQLLSGASATMTFNVTPTNTGTFNDIVNALDLSTLANGAAIVTLTSVTTTNVPSVVNLAVAIVGPVQAVITNDLITYNVSVTNATGSAVSGVIVTNVLPPGIIFKSIAPSNLKLSTVHSNQIFSLGTMQASAFTNIAVTIEPTNAGVLALTAFVNASGGLSSNSVDFATNNVTVMDPLPGSFTIGTNSQQTLNLQNGLTEQSVLLQNTSTTDAPAVRVVVSGLSSKSLFNAVGTNSGNPFVYFSAPLPAGQSTTLLLQYSPRGNFAFTNTQLQAYAVPTPNWSPPSGLAPLVGSTNGITHINKNLSNGDIIVEFSATLGHSYTIIYADNVQMSNAMIAPPSVIAPANIVQWIDYGPPATVSPPMSGSMRFYEVLQNP